MDHLDPNSNTDPSPNPNSCNATNSDQLPPESSSPSAAPTQSESSEMNIDQTEQPAASAETKDITSTNETSSTAMDVDSTQQTSASTSESSTTSSDPSISISQQNLDPEELEIQENLKLMHTDVKKGEASTRAVLKLLQNLSKAPSKLENRRLRRDNIILKKQVVEIKGAQQILELVGYKQTTLNNFPYFLVEESAINHSFLEKAIKLLLEYTERQIQDSKKPTTSTSGERSKCAGGCGFYGDAATENLCSVCYNKKYLGAAATKTLTGVDVNEPKKCVKGCGLFGSARFNGMCSQCFGKQSAQPAPKPKRTAKQHWHSMHIRMHAYLVLLSGRQAPQQNKNRCFICNKKLPVPIECRCRRTFCSDHRFPLDHQCSYDTRSEHKKTLRKNLIVVASEKFDRI